MKSLKLWIGYSCPKYSSSALIQLSLNTLMVIALIIWMKFLKESQKNNNQTRGSFQKLKWSFCKTNTVKLHFVKPYGTTTDTRKQNLYLSFLNDSFMCMIPLLLMDHNKQFYLCIVLFCLRSKCCIFDNNDLI